MKDKELKKLSKEQLIFLIKHEREHFNEAIDRLMDTLIQTESKLEETEKEHKEVVKFLTGRSLKLAKKWLKEEKRAKKKLKEIEGGSLPYGKGTRIVPIT